MNKKKIIKNAKSLGVKNIVINDLKNIFPAMDFLTASNRKGLGDKVDLFDSNDNKHRYKIGKGNLIDMLILSKTKHNQAVIIARYFRGPGFLYTLKTSGGAELLCFLPGSEGLQIDQSIGVQLQFDQPVVFSRR